MEHGIEFVPVQANMGFSLSKDCSRYAFPRGPALEAKLGPLYSGPSSLVLDLRLSPSYAMDGVELRRRTKHAVLPEAARMVPNSGGSYRDVLHGV